MTTPLRVVYVSGPLRAADDLAQARRFYEAIAAACERHGWRAYLPHQHTDPIHHRDVSSQAVFQRDVDALERADALIADVRSPSLGVGAEIGIAFERGIPIVAIRRAEPVPSRFTNGLIEHYEHGRLIQIDDGDFVLDVVIEQLEGLATADRLASA